MLGQSYNAWLREDARSSKDTLVENTERLQDSLQVLLSALELATTMEHSRVLRIISAINHLEVEIHLLDISLERT